MGDELAGLIWQLGKWTLISIISVLALAAIVHPFGCHLYLFERMSCQ